MFKKILVAIDGSNNSYDALNEALELSKQSKAKIYVVSVINVYVLPTNVGVSYAPKLEENIADDMHTDLTKAQQIVKDSGQDYEADLLSGEPREEIINFAKEKQIDLIVIGKSGTHALERLFTGSVTRYISEHSKTSILIVS